jgi:lysophospholipase L1-like esterase
MPFFSKMKLLLKLLLSYCLSFSVKAQTAFLPEIKKFDSLNADILRGQIMGYGSSTIRLWTSADKDLGFDNLKVINRGFGGSKADEAIFYFDRVVMPHRPKWLFFYEGDNDLWAGRSVDTVFQDYQIFINMVKKQLPTTRLVIFSIKHSPSRMTVFEEQQRLNERLKTYCETLKNVYFLDTATPMLNSDGKPDPKYFVQDMLHMNPDGYALWTSVVKKFYKRVKK